MLNINVFQNGREACIGFFTEQEMARLREAIEDLWKPTYHSRREFEVVEDFAGLLLFYCVGNTTAPIPKEWMNKTYRFGAPGVNERTLRLVGDRIPIDMGQSRLEKIEVQFSE